MSEKTMNQEDQQVIDMVNAHNKQEEKVGTERVCGSLDAERLVTKEIAMLRVADATRKRKRQNLLSAVVIVLCTVVAATLLLVMANPEWLVGLVNIGIATCCTVAGITADRYIRREML